MAKIPGITTPGVVDIPKENGTRGAIQDENQKKRGKEKERDKILSSSVIEPQGASFSQFVKSQIHNMLCKHFCNG